MLYKTYLDEFGRTVQDLVLEALGVEGRNPDHLFAIRQYGDSVTTLSPMVTLRFGKGWLRTFRIRYEHQVLSTPQELRDLVDRCVESAYRSRA